MQHSLFAQTDESRFKLSVLKNIKYPEFLRNSCTPTLSNILIIISKDGKIESIQVSDSADLLFKSEFDRIKGHLDTNGSKLAIKRHKLSGLAIMVPVFYVFGTEYCTNNIGNSGLSDTTYYMFNGKPFIGLTMNLNPIISIMQKPVR